eukprot:434294-Pyramimonas_sp.AAC.1
MGDEPRGQSDSGGASGRVRDVALGCNQGAHVPDAPGRLRCKRCRSLRRLFPGARGASEEAAALAALVQRERSTADPDR